MSKLKIAPSNAVALERIAEFDGGRFEKFAQKIARIVAPSIKVSKLLSIAIGISSDEDFSIALCTQLISLATVRRIQKLPPEEIVDELIRAMESNGFSEQTINWYKKQRNSLVSLFESESIRLPAKALHLSTDFDTIFVSGNIITDIRPVFDRERDKIHGAVVNQTLKIHYISSGGESVDNEISLALDTDDIDKLIVELERAKVKAEASKKLLDERAGIEVFVVGEETYGFG